MGRMDTKRQRLTLSHLDPDEVTCLSITMTAPDPTQSDRLESWKEVAEYLGKAITTVRRWERDEGLPVRRQAHLSRGSVIAYKSELDAWRAARTTAPPPSITRRFWPAFAAAPLLLGGIFLALPNREPHPVVAKHILTAYPGAESGVSFAPAGDRFAFVREGDVWIKAVDAEPSHPVWRDTGAEVLRTRWSPDGSRIAFTIQRGKSGRFAVVDPNGERFRELGAGGPEIAWRRDGKALLVEKFAKDVGPVAIFEHEIDTGRERQLTFPPEGSWGDLFASQSPDGGSLAFVRYPIFAKGDVFVSSYGGRDAVRATSIDNWVVGVDWLPSGREIVFGAEPDGNGALHIAEAKPGAKVHMLAGTEGDSKYPVAIALPSGGVRIGYAVERWNPDIKRVIRSSNKAEVIADSLLEDDQPDINAAGSIAFISNRTGSRELWTCDGACQSPRRITNFNAPYVEMRPRWSPAGDRIAVAVKQRGAHHIIAISADGSAQQTISKGHNDRVCGWSANGDAVYVLSARSGSPELWKLSLNAAPPVQVTKGGAGDAFESADGRYLYYSRGPENAPVIRRNLATSEESGLPVRVRQGMWALADGGLFRIGDTAIEKYDLADHTVSTVLTPPAEERLLGLSANRSGEIVYWFTKNVQQDVLAVDIR